MQHFWTSRLSLSLCVLLFTTPIFAAPDNESQARKLINAQGCKACHKLEGAGGTLGASLEEVNRHLTAEEIRLKLVNPEQKHCSGRTPDFGHLNDAEIDILVNFLKRPTKP